MEKRFEVNMEAPEDFDAAALKAWLEQVINEYQVHDSFKVGRVKEIK